MNGAQSAGLGKEPGGSLVPGEFLLTREDFRRLAAMIHADAGIYLPESKAALVYSRLARRLRALGLTSFRDYCRLVAATEGIDERQKMLAALTTNVTRFFREPHHFAHLETTVLPPLIAEARRGGRVRLWSAACSSGQEPYSIALTLLSLMPDAGNYDVKILATDIDPNVLAQAREGRYLASEAAAVPEELRAQWFLPSDEHRGERPGGPSLRVAEGLRNLVVFRELNLFGTWPMSGRFQAIFCRNVAIYFEEAAQEQLWERFVPKLYAGGVLYLGHSERITGPASALFEAHGISTYRLRRERQ